MSDITRDDLRVRTDRGKPDDWPDSIPWFTPPTDEEFDRLAREAGFVKLSDLTSDAMYNVIEDRYGQTGWEAVELAARLVGGRR